MLKVAKSTPDPVQQKLRTNKAVWNKKMSLLINDIINFKKLMNGHPSKFYQQKSLIQYPVPSNPTEIIDKLVSDFQGLSQEASAIVEEQVNYSKTRRQKRKDQGVQTLNKLEEKYGPTGPEVPSPLAPAAPAPTGADLSKQLASWEEKYSLVAEGSNPFSRFLARLKTPQIGFGMDAQKRRLRMDMLKASVKSYRALGKLQVHVVKSSKASFTEAYKSMQEAWNEWSVVSRNFNNLPDQPPKPEEMKDEPPPGTEPDLEVKKPAIAPPPAKAPAPPKVEPVVLTSPPIKGSELPTEENKKLLTASEQLETVAQAFLQKWLGKTRHQTIPGKSSGLRLQVFELAANTRKNIDRVMNLLEKGLSAEELGSAISQVSSQMNTLRSLMRSLHNVEKIPAKGKGAPSSFEGFF